MRRPNGQKNTHHPLSGNHFQYHSAGRGRISSQSQNDQDGSAESIAEFPGAGSFPQNQPASRTVGFHGSSTQSGTRKSQTTNANHLLNFQYDRISRPQPRIPPPRRQQKLRPYNKDLFLQANFRFVVLESGNYPLESMDADKTLEWENIICVRYSTPYPVQCPICLESPLCPQITSCGHIFCFPCILRYLLMGEEDHKGDHWKKCPLCFMMISLKDLYTVYIENVKHYQPGDIIMFSLLTREKSSLIPYQKNLHHPGSVDCGTTDLCDHFSKFSLTSDVDLSIGEAYAELKDWLARAESELVDDLQQLPYVCAALEQLEQRKKFWTEMRSLTGSHPSANSPPANSRICGYSSKVGSQASASAGANTIDSKVHTIPCTASSVGRNNKANWFETKSPVNLDEKEGVTETHGTPDTCEAEDKLSSSYEEENMHSDGVRHVGEKDSYSFYQAVDGQHLILHSLNMKCLLQHYGRHDLLPPRISGKILQMETVTQTEAMRRRYRCLSHFSLTTAFQLCEIDLSEILPSNALLPFMDEIKKRENHRKRLLKKEHQEKVKAEAVLQHSMPSPSSYGHYSVEKSFSMDDFEALGNGPSPSTPPVGGERKRFSDVTRLGFAAAHDSPSLRTEDSNVVSDQSVESVEVSGPRNKVTLSFADIMSTNKSEQSRETPEKMDMLVGKKGKKPSRVLLSTAGGRRY